MPRFCPVCGNPVDATTLRELGSCRACKSAMEGPVLVERGDVRIQICPRCFKFRPHDDGQGEGQWRVADGATLEEIWTSAIYDLVIDGMPDRDEHDYLLEYTEVPETPLVGKKLRVTYEIEMVPRNASRSTSTNMSSSSSRDEERVVSGIINGTIIYSMSMCNDCALKNVGYHNSVVQLRHGLKRVASKHAMDVILDEIITFARQNPYHGIDPVQAVKEVPGGYDVRFMDKNLGRRVVHEVKRHHLVEVKESFKVIGPDHSTGGNLKRLFYSVRLFPYFPGDVFRRGKHDYPWMITGVFPDHVEGLSLENGMIERRRPDGLKHEELVFQEGESTKISLKVMSIDRQDRSAILMRTDTFEELEARVGEWHGNIEPGDEVQAFFLDGAPCILPIKDKVHPAQDGSGQHENGDRASLAGEPGGRDRSRRRGER